MHDFILSIENPPFFKKIFVFIAKSLPCIAFPLFLCEKSRRIGRDTAADLP